MENEECKNALYRELARLQILDKGLFMAGIKDFEVSELLCGGVHVGFLMTKENEIHFYMTKEKAVKYGVWMLRRVIMPLLAKCGELVTLSPDANDKFLLRTGFVNCGMVGEMHKLVLTEIKLKGASCHF